MRISIIVPCYNEQALKPFVLIIHILNILLFQEILEKKLRCMRGFVMWMRTM